MKKRLFTLSVVLLLVAATAFYAFGVSQTTSSLTVSSLITRIRYYIHEPSAVFWSDAELTAYLNDAIYDVIGRTRCTETTEVVLMVSGTTEYSLSTEYIGITGAVHYDGSLYKGLREGSIASLGHYDEAIDEPEFWYEWNNKLGVYPIPSSGTSVIVYMIPKPTGVTSTNSSIETPAIFDRALVLYASAQALYQDNKVASAARLMDEYLAEIDRYRADFIDKTTPKKEIVK
jgi:hypothetical protein